MSQRLEDLPQSGVVWVGGPMARVVVEQKARREGVDWVVSDLCPRGCVYRLDCDLLMAPSLRDTWGR